MITDCGDSIEMTYNRFALPVSLSFVSGRDGADFCMKLSAGIVPPNTKERLPLPGDALYHRKSSICGKRFIHHGQS